MLICVHCFHSNLKVIRLKEVTVPVRNIQIIKLIILKIFI